MMEEPPPFAAHPPDPIVGEKVAAAAATTAIAAAGTARRVRVARSRKRRRISEDVGGWASLPGDLVRLVADRVLLAGDVVDYISLRSVCSGWRTSTDSPHRCGLQELYRRFRPRGWVALCRADATRPDDVCEIAFFNPGTGRRLRARFPEKLRGCRIVAFSGGLLLLLHKRDSRVRVLHPFTRSFLDLPPIAPTFRIVVGEKRECFLRMNAAICTSVLAPDTSVDVVAWFPMQKSLLWANPGDANWNAIILDVDLRSVLAYRGRLYATSRYSANILQVYPQSNIFPVDTPIPDELGHPMCSFLVESDGRMLLAVRHNAALPDPNRPRPTAFKIFDVDIDRRQLVPVSSIGDRALFLGEDRCVSVSAKHLPPIIGNSVYYSYENRQEFYSLSGTGYTESECSPALPPAGPFSITDHLITYCNHREWARGLMFHEHSFIPGYGEELKKKIKKQDSQLRITKKTTSNPSPAT